MPQKQQESLNVWRISCVWKMFPSKHHLFVDTSDFWAKGDEMCVL